MTYVPAHNVPAHPHGRHRVAQTAQPSLAEHATVAADTRWPGAFEWKTLTAAVAIATASGTIGAAIALSTVTAVDYRADHSRTVASIGWAGTPLEHAVATALPSIVTLTTTTDELSAEGSGIVLTADGLILTNNHVVSTGVGPGAGAPVKAEATLADGRVAPFSIAGSDPVTDLAVVRVHDISGLTPISLGSVADLHVGEEVVAIGSPLGLDGTVTAGIVSALHRPIRTAPDATGHQSVLDTIQTDAAINPGGSGGALIDSNGRLVGVNSAIATAGGNPNTVAGGSTGLGFAIPVDQAKRVADELIATGRASHAFLGVRLAADDGTRGARIIEARSGGPAAAAGLLPNTVITRMDDRVITGTDALVAAILAETPGETVSLTIIDPAGVTRAVPVMLASDLDWS
ncbi:MAG TPA: trypsin-like peptidase domain-containing protein [Mycobacterium sp.]|nr:trypsin-like peptidase domain-containing protein [Mycobacterium sp.]